LRDFALSSIGSLHKRADLTKKLLVLSDMELQDLVCNKVSIFAYYFTHLFLLSIHIL